VEAQQFRILGPVGGGLVDTRLEAPAELLIELHVAVHLHGNHLEAFLDKILWDQPPGLVLLGRLARKVQWQLF